MVATVTCFTPTSASSETNLSKSFSSSLTVGIIGSILATAGMSLPVTFVKADNLRSGEGAEGSIKAATSSRRVVTVIDTTVGVCPKMSRSLVTRSDFVTISRGKPFFART